MSFKVESDCKTIIVAMKTFEYCAAIRTLGTAGEKYQTLLNSLNQQTMKPKKILVYIPYGYNLPKETIGWEEYVRCPKGMVTQRSLPFDEIDTEYILFCDDDISLVPSSVESLFQGLVDNDGDCISPNTFPVERLSVGGKLKKAIAGYAFPRWNDGWAFRIMRNSGYTYNNNPKSDVLPTESAAGPCMLIKKKSYLSIHYDDERWIERFGYALGDDLLFYYKLFFMGMRVLIHYNSGIVHLDAGTSSKNLPENWIRKNMALQVIIPHRICYQINRSIIGKWLCILSCLVKFCEQIAFTSLKNIIVERKCTLGDSIKGLKEGYQFVHSEEYKKIPRFDAYIKKIKS